MPQPWPPPRFSLCLAITCVGSDGVLSYLGSPLKEGLWHGTIWEGSMTGKQGQVSKVWRVIIMMIMLALSENQMELRHLLRFSMPHLSSIFINIYIDIFFRVNYCLKWCDNSLFALFGCGWNPDQRAWNLASQEAKGMPHGMNWNPGELLLFGTKFDQGKTREGHPENASFPCLCQIAQDTAFPNNLWVEFVLCLGWPAKYCLCVFPACREVASEVTHHLSITSHPS